MSGSEHAHELLRARAASGNYPGMMGAALVVTAACGQVELEASSLPRSADGGAQLAEEFDSLDAERWRCEGACPAVAEGKATFTLSPGSEPGSDGAWSKLRFSPEAFTSGTFRFVFALPAGPDAEVFWGLSLWNAGPSADQSEYSELNIGYTRGSTFEPARLELVSARLGKQRALSIDTGKDLYDGAFHSAELVYSPDEVTFYLDGELLEAITDPDVIPDVPLALTLGARLVRAPALGAPFTLIVDRCDVEP
jgi:hypothetical protein